jgi:hypothetical protein
MQNLNPFMKKLLLVIVFAGAGVQVHAQKQFAGVFKADVGFSELVTTLEKPCDKPEGNASVLSGAKRLVGCWSKAGDDIRFEALDGSFSKSYALSNIFLVADSSLASKAEPKPKKTHLTCEADGWQLELDVERTDNGDLQRIVAAGDSVLAAEKSTQITFNYDGFAFNLNTITGGFSFETSGVQSYIRKNLMGSGKTKGAGACRVNELVKKF